MSIRRDDISDIPRAAVRTVRHFVDADGVFWLVFEQRPAYEPHASPSLIFESVTAVRRVRAFPPDWSGLSEERLAALSRSR